MSRTDDPLLLIAEMTSDLEAWLDTAEEETPGTEATRALLTRARAVVTVPMPVVSSRRPSRRLRDADRDRIMRVAARTIAVLAPPGVVASIRRELEASRDGLRGTNFDGVRGGGGESSPTERAALTAREVDGDRLDRWLLDLESVVSELERVAVWRPSPVVHQGRRPGVGPCPPGKCQDHWEAGVELKVASRRYRLWCRRCGDHRRDHGSSIPPLVLRAVQESGGDWQHWSVDRAWKSCGGRPASAAMINQSEEQ